MGTSEHFDWSDQYSEMLQKGLRLSGEEQRFFIVGRIKSLQRHLPPNWRPQRILDFGCGIGHTAWHLAEAFPEAEVVGVDSAHKALDKAEAAYGSGRISFRAAGSGLDAEGFDLCYTNGVFHHIDVAQRLTTLRRIYDALVPGGYFALFENNPWNPGTRLVMKRIPFDRDAQPLSPLETRRLLRAAGFSESAPMRFLFYFPRPLACLRFAEPWLARLPFGAQYYALAIKR